MKEEYKYNLTNYLIDNDSKNWLLIFLIIVSIILVIILTISHSVYDIEKSNGITSCINTECYIKYNQYGASESNYNFVKIKNEQYNIENIKYSEFKIDEINKIYQEVIINPEEYQGNDNEIVEISLYKNKDILLKKIWKIILER